MRKSLLVAGLLSVLCAVSVVTTGCVSPKASQRMTRASASTSLTPPAGKATIVFVRPSKFGFAVVPAILNEKGEFIGDAEAQAHFAVNVDPGRHLFVCWAENSAALEATVAAGKTYYVEVAPRMGAWVMRCHLIAIKPDSPNWSKLDTWIAKSRRIEVDKEKGAAYVAKRAEDVKRRVKLGEETFQKYTAGERADRTIAPGDGR